VEFVRLCAAQAAAQRDSARSFFAAMGKPLPAPPLR